MNEFDPYNYTDYAALPLEQHPNFKPVDGGFVNSSALEVDAAWSEVLIDQNIETAQELVAARTVEYLRLAVSTGDQIDREIEAGKSVAQVQYRYDLRDGYVSKVRAAIIYQRDVASLIQDFGITEPIDRDFVDEACAVVDEISERNNSYINDRSILDQVVAGLRANLLARISAAADQADHNE